MADTPQNPQGMNVDENQFFDKYKPTQTEDEFFNKYDNQKVADTHSFWFNKGPFEGKNSDYFFQQTPTGRILSAFGQGAKDGWGQEGPLKSEIKWEAENKSRDHDIVYGFHTSVMRPAAVAVEALSLAKPLNAVGSSIANLVGQTGEELSAAAKQEQEDFAEKFTNHPELARTAATILGAPFGAAGELLKGAASGAGLEGGLEGPRASADHIQVLQDARSKGVIGEGEAGYFKTVEPTPENTQARQEAAVQAGEPYGPVTREEFLGPKLVPNQTEIARQIDPDTFKELDKLNDLKENLHNSVGYLQAQQEIAFENIKDSPKLTEQLSQLQQDRDALDKTENYSELPDTRGQGTQYHGSKGPISGLSEGYYNEHNIYGAYGFYTTDALDVAKGYQRGSDTGTYYKTSEKEPVHMFDMETKNHEQQWSKFLRAGDDGIVAEAIDNASKANNGKPNLRQIMDEMRDLSSSYGYTKNGIQEYFDGIAHTLGEKGFGGMQHTGGLKTNKAPHSVKIYFDPKNQLNLEEYKPNFSDFKAQKLSDFDKKITDIQSKLNKPYENHPLTKKLSDLRDRLLQTDFQLRDLIPDVADAQRRADELLKSEGPEGEAFRKLIQAQAFEKAIALQEAKPKVQAAYRDAADIIPVPEGKTDANSTNSGKSNLLAATPPSAASQIISVLPEYRGGLKDLGKDKTPSRRSKELPPVPEGSVRFYHGAKGGKPDTGGGRWVTTDPRYARDFRRGDKDNEVYYVDIPKGHPSEVAARAWDEIDEQAGTNSVGTYHHLEIPEELAKQLKPIEDKSTGDYPGGLKDVKGGELKESGLNKTIMIDAVQKGFDAKFQDAPLYHSITHADQGQKAFDYLEANEKAAMEVAMGDREPPTGIHPEAILMALKEKAEAEGDIDTIQSLSQTRLGREASVMGQRLGLLRNLRENIDPTEILRGIQELWQEKGSEKITKTIEDIQDTIQKNMTNLHNEIGEWLKSIECDY